MPDRLRVLLVHASAQSALSAFLAEQDMVVDARTELVQLVRTAADADFDRVVTPIRG